MQIVVLAGGMMNDPASGAQVPEVLYLQNGKPFIDWQLDRLVASGARSLVMCVGHMGEEIETHVRRALDRGLTVGYSYAGDQLTGSGGAVRRAFARLASEFLVTFGNRYFPFDCAALLEDLRAHPEASATLGVSRVRGNITLEGDLVARYDGAMNGDFADAGVVALRRSALQSIEDGAVWELSALWRQLTRAGKLRAFVTPDPSLYVGSMELTRYLAGLPVEAPLG